MQKVVDWHEGEWETHTAVVEDFTLSSTCEKDMPRRTSVTQITQGCPFVSMYDHRNDI